MISKFRMKIDLLGQVILVIAVLLLAFFKSGFTWTNTLLGTLALWQIASAIHLLLVYRHIKKIPFLKTMFVLLISLPIWINFVGMLAYIPVVGVIIWYLLQTIFETRIVYRRPRYFWDL